MVFVAKEISGMSPRMTTAGACLALESCHCLVIGKREAVRILGEKMDIIFTAQSMLHLLWKSPSSRSQREVVWLAQMLMTMKFFGQLPVDLVRGSQ